MTSTVVIQGEPVLTVIILVVLLALAARVLNN